VYFSRNKTSAFKDCILAFGKAKIQFLENYTGDFQIEISKKIQNFIIMYFLQ
jgi:hypothetical protein